MTNNMDVFLKQNEEKENLPKVSEEAILNAAVDNEQRMQQLTEFIGKMPRKMRRKMFPDAKFSNQLAKKLRGK